MRTPYITAGLRHIDTVGPRGGSIRRFQVWIETSYGYGDPRTFIEYGETFTRQWEAAAHAAYTAEMVRAAHAVATFWKGGTA